MEVVLGELDFPHSSGFQGGPALAGSEILLWVVLSFGEPGVPAVWSLAAVTEVSPGTADTATSSWVGSGEECF